MIKGRGGTGDGLRRRCGRARTARLRDTRRVISIFEVRLRSAGTYSSKKEANKAWQEAEVQARRGAGDGDLTPGPAASSHRYVEETSGSPTTSWSLTTREGYTYEISKHIVPWFGQMRMVDILPSHVREWVTHLRTARC